MVTYTYALSNSGKWTQFPDLAATFNLDWAQFVQVRYNIQTINGHKCYFVTRLMVDRKEDILFRIHTGYHYYHSHSNSDEIWLEKGKHTIAVEYRSNCNSQNIGFWDWNIAALLVRWY